MSASTRPQVAAKRYVYTFGAGVAEGDGTMRDLLGGKGAGLAEMTKAGLPVPPGFTITTEACNDYFGAGETLPQGLWEDVKAAVAQIEAETGKGFGNAENPLLVSVRSGAKFSMPGMMDTVLNLGLNEETLEGIIKLTANERFGWDAYRRFIQLFGRIVLGVSGEHMDEAFDVVKERVGAKQDTDVDAEGMKAVVQDLKQIVLDETGKPFPQDPYQQLDLAIKAVFASWFGKRARDYRDNQKIAHDLGTAVNVMTMVFGNMGQDSGTGVAFSRNPSTGENVLFGEYLTNAQGEDVVAGIRTPSPIAHLAEQMPEAHAEFQAIADRLEHHYRDMQDMEFTIERGKLYMLQTRSGKRTAAAAVKIAVDMVAADIITKEEALVRIEPGMVDQLLRDQYDPAALKGATRIARGLNASPGAAVGRAIFSADDAVEWVERGEKVVLVRVETSPDDFHGMAVAQGILTARGGATSHAAVVARQIGKPCVAGCAELVVDYKSQTAKSVESGVSFAAGDWISLDGSTGEVYEGALGTVSADYDEQDDLKTVLGWADEIRRLGVWTNADKPEEAERARSYGAEGIGLCRTEHMFREGERLEIVRGAILVSGAAMRARAKAEAGEAISAEEQAAVDKFEGAMSQLEVLQQGDFEGIFEAMKGLPVVVRLIDPPLHEFLPNLEETLVEVTKAGDAATAEQKQLLATVQSMHEQNPMLGLRGVRLGLIDPRLRQGPDPRHPQRAGRGQQAWRRCHRQDHDPARRACERAVARARPARGRGQEDRGGLRRPARLQVRHHDRDPARRLDGRRDRGGGLVLQLRHQRPHADGVRLQP